MKILSTFFTLILIGAVAQLALYQVSLEQAEASIKQVSSSSNAVMHQSTLPQTAIIATQIVLSTVVVWVAYKRQKQQ